MLSTLVHWRSTVSATVPGDVDHLVRGPLEAQEYMVTTPSADEVHGYFESLSNWSRWGKDDCLGTLNFVTPEITVAAARELIP